MWTRERLFIGGKWVTPATAETLEVISPSTEHVVGRVPAGGAADVDHAVEAARAAFDTGPWPRLSPDERAGALERIADLLAQRAAEITEVITSSAGFPITQTRLAQIALPQAFLRYYAGLIRSTPLDQRRVGVLSAVHVRHTPIGVVGAIVPWNIPLLGTIATLAPAWAAGCTAVLKPAPHTPLDAFLLAEITEAAGLPPGVFNVVPGGPVAGARLVAHPGVDKISFTGSTETGKRIAASCAQSVKSCVLELGGNAASVVLDDARAEQVATGLVRSGLAVNSGQACIAQTRVVVPHARAGEITDALVAATQAIPVGDPFDEATLIGPMISSAHRDRVRELIEIGRAEGATLLTGGTAPTHPDHGWYITPAVFAGVHNDMRIARREISARW